MSPESLASQFISKSSTYSDTYTDGTIPAVYANFGFVPYGKKIMGKLHFDQQNKQFCDEPDSQVFNRTNMDSSDLTPFFMAVRGNCSFVQKVRQME